MLPWEDDNGAEQVERASHLSIKRKGISVRDPGECSSLMVRVVWHVQGSQARPGVKGRQSLRRLMLHSLPGAQTSLSSSSQTSITWHNMQRAMWPTGWEKRRRCQSLNALTVTMPSASRLELTCQHHALFLLISLAEPIYLCHRNSTKGLSKWILHC